MPIETAHLQLLPYAPEHLLALIDGVPQFEKLTGLVVAEGLHDFMVSDEVSPAWLEALRASSAPDPWLHGFAIVDLGSMNGTLVNGASIKEQPLADGDEIRIGATVLHFEAS